MFDSIGFIGAGRITRIMLNGWQNTGVDLPPVYVFDQSPEAINSLSEFFPQIQSASLSEVASKSLVFIALHPPVIDEVLNKIYSHLDKHAVLCSLAPKLRLSMLQEKLHGFDKLSRMNPNAASIVGKGYNPISFAVGLPQDLRSQLIELVSPLGNTPVVDDNMIENYAVISAMGPTYFWFQFEALRQQAESFGMTEEEAREAVVTMLHGAVDTLFSSGMSPSKVMDLVPVRPMADDESTIIEMQRKRLNAIHTKLHS
jgi:pyrroline-5-carboxylate reductase